MYTHTSMESVKVRKASLVDIPLILSFMKENAEYEKMLDEVTATEASIRENIFDNNRADVVIAELDGVPVGYALYFYNFSTFTGKSGIYLEDIFVRKVARGKGIGKILFNYLIDKAKEKGCVSMDWACLDWNTPSIKFYESLGAVSMEGWTSFRLTEDKIHNFNI